MEWLFRLIDLGLYMFFNRCDIAKLKDRFGNASKYLMNYPSYLFNVIQLFTWSKKKSVNRSSSISYGIRI